ncbi:MAG: HNH endonuclease [Saprospiraceae bacterium]|nr:HNH endonuclease [Saprospiraceae bacterium]
MSRHHISNDLRQKVVKRANFCCEYCLVPEAFLATVFHIEHIRSIKHGGKTLLNNLAYACPHCNQNKGSDVATFLNDESDELIRFFNPRIDVWHEHFEINEGEIVPKTNLAKVTIRILNINQIDRIIFRKALMDAGVY